MKKFQKGGKVGDKTYNKAVNTFYDYRDQLRGAYDTSGVLTGDNLWKALGYNPNKPETMGNVNEYFSAINNIKNRNQGLAATDSLSANSFGPGLYDLNPPSIKRFNQNPTNVGLGPIKRIPEYGLGGVIASFVGKANPFVALGSGLFNIGKGIFQGIKQNREQKRFDSQAKLDEINQKQESNLRAENVGNAGWTSGGFAQTFPFGGMAGDNLIKIQKNETVQQPDGSVIQANAGTHAAGTDVAVRVADGSIVMNDEDKLAPIKGGPTFAEIHADLTRRINKIKNKK